METEEHFSVVVIRLNEDQEYKKYEYHPCDNKHRAIELALKLLAMIGLFELTAKLSVRNMHGEIVREWVFVDGKLKSERRSNEDIIRRLALQS